MGWRAEVVSSRVRDGVEVHLWRPGGNGEVQYLMSTDLTIGTAAEGTYPDTCGLFLPHDVWRAVVAAVDPAPHGAEVRRLEEALGVERDRVDAVLRLVSKEVG